MYKRGLVFMLLSAMALCSLGAASASNGTIRGYVFRDSNQNGFFDTGEEGIPGVYVTISYGSYEHTYYTGAGDGQGSSPGPGSYGPTALQSGYWKATLHVPDGYRATTLTEMYVKVNDSGATTGVNFGLYGTGPITYAAGTGVGMGGGAGILPQTGVGTETTIAQLIALLLAAVGLVLLVGTPWCVTRARRAHQRWW